MASKTVAIASDHAGFDLKSALKDMLSELGYEPLDCGTTSDASVDYPDFADALAGALAEGRAARGVLVCGTGLGIAMAANRHRNVRAAPCRDVDEARLARQHNDANVIAFGARTTDVETVRDCLRVFLSTEFEGGRHRRRVDKMS